MRQYLLRRSNTLINEEVASQQVLTAHGPAIHTCLEGTPAPNARAGSEDKIGVMEFSDQGYFRAAFFVLGLAPRAGLRAEALALTAGLLTWA